MVSLWCETCGLEIWRDDAPIGEAEIVMLAAHCAPPHAGSHKISARVDRPPVPDVALVVHCKQCDARYRYEAPRDLALVTLLAHHACHEGHPMGVSLVEDGRERRLYPQG